MGAFDDFVDSIGLELDITQFVADDVEKIEQQIELEHVYKFYPVNLLPNFFAKPRVRFTQRTELNDPFELTTRWNDFAPAGFRKSMIEYIRHAATAFFARPDVIAKAMAERPEFNHYGSRVALEKKFLGILQGPEGRRLIEEQAKALESSTIPGLEQALINFEGAGPPDFFKRVTTELGIFSVSESATNEQLWGLYAQSGKGFVVQFNARHEFFKNSNGNNTLRKVIYTDEIIPNFLSNPYYFFLVKNAQWSFEQEWRTTRRITECDTEPLPGLCLWNVPRGAIGAVITGYNSDLAEFQSRARIILRHDSDIQFKKAILDIQTRRIVIEPLR